MTDKPTNVLIIVRAGHREAPPLAENIQDWLKARGVRSLVAAHPGGEYGGNGAEGLPLDGCDLVLVLGGDGTMISVARQVAGRAPMIGLNMGRLGFLSELTPDDWMEFLESALTSSCRCSERLMLEYSVFRDGERAHRGLAVNDVVLNRGSLARLIRLELGLDGESLGDLRADGLVISSPTGSTAYSISSGGPIVQPELDVFSVTPICPFLHNFRPMVLPGDSVFSVGVQGGRAEVYLTVDGQDCISLEPGDEVRIGRAESVLRLLEPKRPAWVPRLRAKGLVE